MLVVDETESDLKRLIAADFGTSSTGDFHADFVNWIHFRARRVPQLPRKIFTSQEVTSHRNQYPAIDQIRLALGSGGDVRPWLSQTIAKNKNNHKADMMFNDWQILHFHLSRIFQTPNSIRRTGPLLYAHITADEATFLDVQPHGRWTMTNLLEILLRTNAPGLERYEARSATPMRLTDDEYRNLRRKGGNSMIEIGGRAFFPGGGLLASGHAGRIYRYRDWLFGMIDKIRQDMAKDLIEPHLKTAIYSLIGVPVRLGVYYDDSGMAIIDKNRRGLVLHQMKPLE
ncbi:hypothetical protein [Acidiphilium sp.]|uniref:hypothetical protein n=1 Tax=Acidiphilium sp. TaxID=527 RepID=UPI003D03031E